MTALAPSFGAVDVDKSAGEAVRVVRVEGDQLNVVNWGCLPGQSNMDVFRRDEAVNVTRIECFLGAQT